MCRFVPFVLTLSTTVLLCNIPVVVTANESPLDNAVAGITETRSDSTVWNDFDDIDSDNTHPQDRLLAPKKGKDKPHITKSTWWNKYVRTFGRNHLKKCNFLKGKTPVHGTACPDLGHGDWYMCMYGPNQKCEAATSALPGLEGFTGAKLGKIHPTTQCTCTEDKVWNCNPWDPCVPTFCGGFGNFPCPSGLVCVDNPNDGCDTNNGGADCGGICVAPARCAGLLGLQCPLNQICVDDPSNCGIAADCLGICVDTPPQQQCAGLLGLQCPLNQICVDDPSNCGIAADCLGICIDIPPPRQCGGRSKIVCESGETCFTHSEPVLCIGDDGTTSNCLDVCQKVCGGLIGTQCDTGYVCVDDPRDECAPPTGADCIGICSVPEPASTQLALKKNPIYCPDSVPTPSDSCPADVETGSKCVYGKVCCCGQCYDETTCVCGSDGSTATGNMMTMFECSTIAIKCSSTCPDEFPSTTPIADIGCPSRQSWPELLGQLGVDAKALIEAKEPCLSVFIIPEGTAVTEDYQLDRVRIFVNSTEFVVVIPQIG
jgi:Potato inhibitor I family